MEILIPGLILVALMAWASTRIKKRAADAFEPEQIDTENYSLNKPGGFLHVLGDTDHDFIAYSREFGEEDNAAVRRATIEVDISRNRTLNDVLVSIKKGAERVEITSDADPVYQVIAEETANQTPITAFYKIIGIAGAIISLRFAVITGHKNEYKEKIDGTLRSFAVRSN